MPDQAQFLCAWISNSAPRSRGSALYWSAPYPTLDAAIAHGQALLDRGEATFSCVVVVAEDGTRRAIPGSVRPRALRRVVEHWEEIRAAL